MYRVRFIDSDKPVYVGDDPHEALAQWVSFNTMVPCVVLEQQGKRLWWRVWRHIKPYDLPLTKADVLEIYRLNRMDDPFAVLKSLLV